jgi:hypothetical protein
MITHISSTPSDSLLRRVARNKACQESNSGQKNRYARQRWHIEKLDSVEKAGNPPRKQHCSHQAQTYSDAYELGCCAEDNSKDSAGCGSNRHPDTEVSGLLVCVKRR